MAEGYRLYPETKEVLGDLSNTRARMGIVTSTTRRNVRAAFSKFGLDRYFVIAVAREDVEQLKPHPEGIQRALNRIGWKAGMGFYFVGDSAHDVKAAAEAGGISIAVDRGLHKLDEVSPDFTIHSLRGVMEIVVKAQYP